MEYPELSLAAHISASRCMKVKPEEDIIILRDSGAPERIGIAFASACISMGAHTSVITYFSDRKAEPKVNYSGDYYSHINQIFPSVPLADSTLEAMKNADAVFIYTENSYPFEAIKQVMESGTRVLVGYQLTEESFVRTLLVDYDQMLDLAQQLADRLKGNCDVTVSSKAGTRLRFRHTIDREIVFKKYLGICWAPGELGQLPIGMVSTSPLEGSGKGSVIVDGSIFGVPFPLQESLRLEVTSHKITKIEGGGSIGISFTEEIDDAKEDNSYNFPAEWGIGLNPGSVMNSSVEGETCYGTLHFGIGRNTHVAGGLTESKFHADVNIKNPKVQVDGETILESGVFIL